jgi:hypothetical protein
MYSRRGSPPDLILKGYVSITFLSGVYAPRNQYHHGLK